MRTKHTRTEPLEPSTQLSAFFKCIFKSTLHILADVQLQACSSTDKLVPGTLFEDSASSHCPRARYVSGKSLREIVLGHVCIATCYR